MDEKIKNKVIKLVMSGASLERISKRFGITKDQIVEILVEAKLLSK